MTDQNRNFEAPLVTRVDAEIPLVLPPGPAQPPLPRPGFADAIIYTLAYAVVVFGTMIAFVGAALLWEWLFGDADALKPKEGVKAGTVAALPESLTIALGVAVIAGYSAGIGFTVLVFRRLVGRNWMAEVGLLRFPVISLAIAIVAFPGFSVGSDLLASGVYRIFGADSLQSESAKGLRDLLQSFHWSFAVLAVGVFPGVAEELWCRGFLGRGLVGRYGVLTGVALTSMFFGLLHLVPPYVLVTAVMGAALHFTYLASRSLWVPILIHALNNSYAGLAAAGAVADPLPGALSSHPVEVAAAAVGVLVSGGATLWITRPRERTSTAASDGGSPGRIFWLLPPAAFSFLLLLYLFG